MDWKGQVNLSEAFAALPMVGAAPFQGEEDRSEPSPACASFSTFPDTEVQHSASLASLGNPFASSEVPPSPFGSAAPSPFGATSSESASFGSLSPFGDLPSSFGQNSSPFGGDSSPFSGESSPFATSSAPVSPFGASAPLWPFGSGTSGGESPLQSNPFDVARSTQECGSPPRSEGIGAGREETIAPGVLRIHKKRTAEKGKRKKPKGDDWPAVAMGHLQAFLSNYFEDNPDYLATAAATQEEAASVWSSVNSGQKATLSLVKRLIAAIESQERKDLRLPANLGRYVLDFVLLCDEEEGRPVLESLIPRLDTSSIYISDTDDIAPITYGPSKSIFVVTSGLRVLMSDMKHASEHEHQSPLRTCLSNARHLWALDVFRTALSSKWEGFFHRASVSVNRIPLVQLASHNGFLKEYCEICPLALPSALRMDSALLSECPTALIPWVWDFIVEAFDGPEGELHQQALLQILRWAGTSSTDRDTKDVLFMQLLSRVTPRQEPLLRRVSRELLLEAIRTKMQNVIDVLWPLEWVSWLFDSPEDRLSILMAAAEAGMIEVAKRMLDKGSMTMLLTRDTTGGVPISPMLGKSPMEEWALGVLHGENERFPVGEEERSFLLNNPDELSRAMYFAASCGYATALEKLFDIAAAFKVPVTTAVVPSFLTPLSDEVRGILLDRIPHDVYPFSTSQSSSQSIVSSCFQHDQSQNAIAILKVVPCPYPSASSSLITDFSSSMDLEPERRRRRLYDWKNILPCFEACPSELLRTSAENLTILHIAAASFPLEGIEATRRLVPSSMTLASAAGRTPLEMALARTNLSPEDMEAIQVILAPSTLAKRADA